MIYKNSSNEKEFEKHSLAKLFIIFIFVSLALFFINISILILPQADVTFNELNNDNKKITLLAIKNQFNLFIENHIQILTDIAKNPIVINSAIISDPESSSLNDFLDYTNILGKKIPLSLIDIEGTSLYSTNENNKFPSKKEFLWHQIIDNEKKYSVKIAQHPKQSLLLIAVAVNYRGSNEGTLIGEIPIDPYSIFGQELLAPGRYISINKDNEIITTVDQPLSTLSTISSVSEKYDITFSYLTDTEPTVNKKNSLLINFISSILLGSFISFLLLLFLSNRLLAKPFRELNETRDAISSAIDGIAIIDANGKYISVNNAFAHITGYTTEELIDEDWRKNICSSDTKLLENAYKTMQKAGKVTLELRALNKQEEEFYIQVTLVPRLSQNHEVDGCYYFAKDIHEKKAAEDKIKEINSHFNAIINNANSVIFIKNLKNQFIIVNEYFLNLIEKKSEEVIGKNNDEIFDANTAEFYSDTDNQVITHKKTLSYEEHRNINGKDYYFASVKFPLYRTDGSMYAIGGIKTDITEAKNKELQINETSHRFKALYNNTPVMMHSINKEGIIISVSEHWLDTMGYNREDVIGKSSLEFLTDDSKQYAKNIAIPQFFKEGTCNDVAYQMVKNNGNIIDVSLSAISEYDSSGHFIRSSAVIIDVTDKIIAEKELQKQKRELELIFNNVPLAIFYKDDKNHILRLNQTAAATMGGTASDFEGKNTYDLFPEMAKKYHDDDLNVIRSGIPKLGIIEQYHPKGATASWVKTDKVPYIDPATREKSVLVVAQDITEQRDAEEKLKQTMGALKKSNQELEKFVYIASHDLKSPLRSINQLSERISTDAGDALNTQSKEHLNTLRKRVWHMERLLEDLLDYAKISDSKNSCSIKVNAQTIINEACELITIPAEFTIHLDASLDKVVIHTMPIRHIFYNIVGNTIKHHDKSSGNIHLWVEELDNYYRFYIKDDGPGIDDDYQDKVFNMFEKHHSKNDMEGSGMGLAFVQKIVLEADGKIALESNKGEGTTFIIDWPKDQESDTH